MSRQIALWLAASSATLLALYSQPAAAEEQSAAPSVTLLRPVEVNAPRPRGRTICARIALLQRVAKAVTALEGEGIAGISADSVG